MITITTDRRSEQTLDFIQRVDGATRRSIRQAWFAFGKALLAEANTEILRKPKSGRTYIVRGPSGRKRRHVASAPGETHANLSGDLRRSLSWKVFGTDQMDFGYGVIPGRDDSPEYASFVEFGTSRMAERPSLNNAIQKISPQLQGFFDTAFTEEMRR